MIHEHLHQHIMGENGEFVVSDEVAEKWGEDMPYYEAWNSIMTALLRRAVRGFDEESFKD